MLLLLGARQTFLARLGQVDPPSKVRMVSQIMEILGMEKTKTCHDMVGTGWKCSRTWSAMLNFFANDVRSLSCMKTDSSADFTTGSETII